MLADDPLGAGREDSSANLNGKYIEAFCAISDDSNNELLVAEIDQQLAGMLQLTYIPYLTHTGSWRCLIEGVRVHSGFRGQGLGRNFLDWAMRRAKQKGVSVVQLTTDKRRPDAIRFYESMGFVASHQGMKKYLD